MRIAKVSFIALGLMSVLSLPLGCGGAPASVAPEEVPATAALKVEQPKSEPAKVAPEVSTTQTESSPASTARVAGSESEPRAVEVGYKIGMQAPEFGMSLLDGTKVTSASLTEAGKPTFIYFHATW